MADDKLPCWRLLSISPTSSDSVMFRNPEISFMPFQKASSRLTLVLWPATTIDRFTTGDFMMRPRHQCDADPAVYWRGRCAVPRAHVRTGYGRTSCDWRRLPVPTALSQRASCTVSD